MSKLTLTDATFENVIATADKPIVVDFWATHCGPCKMVGPALEKVGVEMADVIAVAFADTAEAPQTVARLGVKTTPTLIIFKNGQPVAQKAGAMLQSHIRQWIGQHV